MGLFTGSAVDGTQSPLQRDVALAAALEDRAAPLSRDAVLATASTQAGLQIPNAAITALDATKLTNLATAWNAATGYDASKLTTGNLALGAGQQVGFYGAAAGAQQTAAALTNSVTSGGSNDTVADYTTDGIYLNAEATIRNNQYQLARKLAEVVTALRTYGLLG